MAFLVQSPDGVDGRKTGAECPASGSIAPWIRKVESLIQMLREPVPTAHKGKSVRSDPECPLVDLYWANT
jgi:hypothetical protein